MEYNTTAYQTLEDRGNEEEVIENAPFKCLRNNAWLGEGYYFWDKEIRHAKYWGINSYNGKYVVAKFDMRFNKLFDLVGNPIHQKMFIDFCSELRKEYITGNKPIIANHIIRLLRDMNNENPDIFDFEAIKTQDCPNPTYVYFTRHLKEKMVLGSRMQICLFEKGNHNFIGRTQIVYPDKIP